MQTVRLAHHAMGTRFECVLAGEDAVQLRAAGEEALYEIDLLERRFSFYRADSELSRLNRLAAEGPVPVAPDLFELLTESKRLWKLTEGTFDPAIGALMKSWGFTDGTGAIPAEEVLHRSRAVSGMQHVILDPAGQTVSFSRVGISLDLGGLAKGFAIDTAIQSLREAGIRKALLHGGTSTVLCLGNDYQNHPWKVAIPDAGGRIIGEVTPGDGALSVSAISGKFFEQANETFGHVIDPHTGAPTAAASVAAVMADSATVSDALSTAVLVLGDRSGLLNDACRAWGVCLIAEPTNRWIGTSVLSFPAYQP